MPSANLSWTGVLNNKVFNAAGNWIPLTEQPTPGIGQTLDIASGEVDANGSVLSAYNIHLSGFGPSQLDLANQNIDTDTTVTSTTQLASLMVTGNVGNYGHITETGTGSGSTFTTVKIQPGAVFVSIGAIAVQGNLANLLINGPGTFINSGLLNIDAGRAVVQNMIVSGNGPAGQMTLENGGVLEITGATNSSISFADGKSDQLLLDTPSATNTIGAISGFQKGDVIQIAGTVAQHQYQNNGSSGVLSVSNAAGVLLGQIKFNGTYTDADFGFQTSGGNSVISSTFTPPPPPPPPNGVRQTAAGVVDLSTNPDPHGFRDAQYTVNGPHDVTIAVTGENIHATNVDTMHFVDGSLYFDNATPGGKYVPDDNASAVARAYYTVLGRPPEIAGETYWTQQIAGNHGSLHDLIGYFYQGAEFQSTYGALDNHGFVDRLYRNTLHRPAEASGQQFWESNLNNNALARQDVVSYFSESAENRANLFPVIEKAGIVFSDHPFV